MDVLYIYALKRFDTYMHLVLLQELMEVLRRLLLLPLEVSFLFSLINKIYVNNISFTEVIYVILYVFVCLFNFCIVCPFNLLIEY